MAAVKKVGEHSDVPLWVVRTRSVNGRTKTRCFVRAPNREAALRIAHNKYDTYAILVECLSSTSRDHPARRYGCAS